MVLRPGLSAGLPFSVILENPLLPFILHISVKSIKIIIFMIILILLLPVQIRDMKKEKAMVQGQFILIQQEERFLIIVLEERLSQP